MIFPTIRIIISSIFVIIIFAINTFAQINAYHSIINPYKKSGLQMPTFGAYFSAVPAKDGHISTNPSAMISLENTNIAVSGNYWYSISYIASNGGSGSGEQHNGNHLNPGSISIVHPSGSRNPRMLLHLTFNPQILNMTDLGHRPSEPGGLYEEQGAGKPASVVVGLVIKAIDQIGIGLSWTKWFGSTKWIRPEYVWDSLISYNEKSIKYNGSNFQISNYLDLNFFRLGFVYNTPFTLMRVAYRKLSQEFNGAYEIGLSSETGTGLTFAVNYFYQNSFKMKHWDIENNYDEKYTKGQELSFGIEYENKKSKILSSAFFLFKLHWLPVEEGSGYTTYFGSGIGPDDRPGFEITMGTSYTVSNLTLLLAVHYKTYYTKLYDFSPSLAES